MWTRVSSRAGSPGRSFTSRTLCFFGAVIHSSMRIYYNLTGWHATSFKLGPRPVGFLSHADGSGLLPEARPKLTALSWEEIRLALMLDIGLKLGKEPHTSGHDSHPTILFSSFTISR